MSSLLKNNDLDSIQDLNENSPKNKIFLLSKTDHNNLFLLKNMDRLKGISDTNEDYNMVSTSRNTLRENRHKCKSIKLPPISNQYQDKNSPTKNQKKTRRDFYGNKIKKGGSHKVSFLDDVNSLKNHLSNLRYNYTHDETYSNNKKKLFSKNENKFIQIIEVECFKKLIKKNSYVVPKNIQFLSKTANNCQCCCIF